MASSLLQPLLAFDNDGLITATSDEQVKTEGLIRELLSLYIPQPGSDKPAVLDIASLELNRAAHVRWLTGILNPLPAPYTSLDASRPWLLYWVTHSLALMNVTLDKESKKRAIETIKSFWNAEEGGFGGGPGQMAHLAPTYASVSALCYLVADDEKEAWDWIDRQAIHDWLLSLKQPDGSFVMHKGGEVDVRGCYCALTTAVVLNILTPDLARGTSQFIASCQTYEGGLASASHPLSFSSPALGEAHGGYTFCALASYFALLASPSLSSSSPSTSNGSSASSLNPKSLLRWASHMQCSPIEAGGFKGRSNKLVDGCYSWWCGGLFSILSALLPGTEKKDLFNRTALQEYALIAAQAPHGGLRDKPGKGADAYHSCYNLSGLSAAQHSVSYDTHELRTTLEKDWTEPTSQNSVTAKNESATEANQRMKDVFCSALSWKVDESRKIIVGKKENEIAITHPVYDLVVDSLERMMRWSYGQEPKVGLEEIA